MGARCDQCSITGQVYPHCTPATSAPVAPTISNTNMAHINFVWGVTPSDPIQYVAANDGFNVAAPACQDYLIDVCERLHVDAQRLALQPVFQCWPQAFKAWVIRTSGPNAWPLPRELFLSKLVLWTRTEGSAFLTDIGFERGGTGRGGRQDVPQRVQWIRVRVYALDMPRYAAGFRALPLFNSLERLTNFAINRKDDDTPLPEALSAIVTSEGMGGLGTAPACLAAPAFQTSGLWPRMFTEVSAVHGTIWAIGIIGVSAFLTVLLFTASVRTSACVIANISAVLACVLAFFYMAGHQLGIVEAVSISVLLGSSVDYSLHIADSYTECCLEYAKEDRERATVAGDMGVRGGDQSDDGDDAMRHFRVSVPTSLERQDTAWRRERRLLLAQVALRRIGGSVWHAAITTFLSVICLVACVVAIFVEFGQIIAASVISSISFALLVLPALLARFGPTDLSGSNICWRHLLAALWACAVCGSTLLGLYLYDISCGECVAAPDGSPLFHSLGQ
jgi:hypothetical protein